MMRQAGVAASGDNRRQLRHPLDDAVLNYEPTPEDRILRLQDSAKKGLCKGKEKKALLCDVLKLEKKLLELADGDARDTKDVISKD